jgi:class 3 adenylate cyclase/predicted ATPase/DNA-binding SARP family transcriptional activator
MDFCILGPLEVLERGRPLALGGRKQRALLGLLLLHAGEAVSTDRLVDELWGERPPATAAKLVQGYVAALRKLLPDGVLVTRAPGYLVELDETAHSLDLQRFERLVASANDAAPERAVGLLREALALWRGPALGDLRFGGLAASEASGLDDSRLVALTRRIELELALGRHTDLVGELENLVAEHPFQERLRAQLILALYRSGRQAEALGAYREARRALDELGIVPGATLQQLEKQILTHDKELDPLPGPNGAARASPAVGTPPVLAPPPPTAREQRKIVTVLFCDLTGSTALGESVDPEALRLLLVRYFERMRGIVEAHGGTVEKFIGDAVMAVFGVPLVHEDDALRAVRVAAEMRAALPALGVQARIGVNTGEVVTGTAERLVTGDAVNVAQRLEAAAAEGEVLLGEKTLALVRDTVEVEPVEPLALKGKSRPVAAYRLLALRALAERPLRAPMVGRKTQLRRLNDALAQAVHDRSCQLFTVLGAAGVGKSRLVAEFAGHADARVVRGRCLSYGQAITYHPVVEIVNQLGALPEDEFAAAAIRSLLGETTQTASTEELAWAFRKLLEQVAQERTLVCVFDDLQWGEETFLDLLEHIADLARDAPILLLCMARPELLDRRPAWGGGKLNATTVLLEPLDAAETEELLDALGGVDAELRPRIAEAAEGNPLFLEEMLALVRESGARDVPVPPTIQALLAARLDLLDPGERSVLEHGAIEGRVFHRSTVETLSDGDGELSRKLASLVRKELVRADNPQLAGEDAYRFRHQLIRDAAYDALPKAIRAELHERFAHWLEERGTRLVEQDEHLGFHLEQATRYRREIGAFDSAARALSARGARHLTSAGLLACSRGDEAAMAHFLERAASLHPADSMERIELLPELGRALTRTGEFRRAESVLVEATEQARAAGDRALELDALLAQQMLQNLTGRELAAERAIPLARRAISVFAELDDRVGLARGWSELSIQHAKHGRLSEGERAVQKQITHALHAQDPRVKPNFGLLARNIAEGVTPVRRALERCEQLLARVRGPREQASVYEVRGELRAMLGEFAAARADVAAAESAATEFGLKEWAASLSMRLGDVELLAGNPAAAEQTLRPGCETLQQIGDLSHFSSAAARLARAFYEQRRYEEAFQTAKKSEEAAADDDLDPQVLSRMTRAKVLARWERFELAERLAHEAVRMSEPTDMLNLRATALADLAEVLCLAGRPTEAASTLRQAIHLYDKKGNVVSAAKARTQLSHLGPLEPPA